MPNKSQPGGGGSVGIVGGGTAAGGTRGVRQTTYKGSKTAYKKSLAADKRSAKIDKKVGKIWSKDNAKMAKEYQKTGEIKPSYTSVPGKLKSGWKKNKATSIRQAIKMVEVKKPGVSMSKPSIGTRAKPSIKTLKKGKK